MPMEGAVLPVPPPTPPDAAKAAADAEAEAARIANLEALKKMYVIRRWSVKISTHEDFEFMVFILIFANIVTLAMYNPLESDSSRYNFILDRTRKFPFCVLQRGMPSSTSLTVSVCDRSDKFGWKLSFLQYDQMHSIQGN